MVSKIGKVLIKIDRICDYLPISPVCNLVNLFEKCAFRGRSEGSIASNSYVSYVKSKKNWRCAVLLLPVLGNLIIAIHDIVQYKRKLRIKALITTTTDNVVSVLSSKLNHFKTSYQHVIERPSELKDNEVIFDVNQEAHRKEKAEMWEELKECLPLCRSLIKKWGGVIELSGSRFLGEREKEALLSTFYKQIAAIEQIFQDMLRMRRESYRQDLAAMDDRSVLREAKEYYLKLTPEADKDLVEEMTIEKAKPLLRQRVVELTAGSDDVVELEEIILRFNRLV